MLLGSRQEMGVDQHREHAERLVVLDEAHAAHIGRQVVDLGRAVHGLHAGVAIAQIEASIVGLGEHLVPLVVGLEVDRADVAMAARKQIRDQVAADEPAGPGHQDELVLVHRASQFARAAACGTVVPNLLVRHRKRHAAAVQDAGARTSTASKRAAMASMSKACSA